jgi:hypothetical protein
MTNEQKELYLNASLAWFYQDAVNSMDIQEDVKLSKRVSALGDLINSTMVLPLDPKITGFDRITIESSNEISIYQLEGSDKVFVLGLPSFDLLNEQEYETSVWISSIGNAGAGDKENHNFSVRADIKKTFSQYNDEEEKSHQTEHYEAVIRQDTTWIPETHKNDELEEWHDIEAELDLHYHSKYSQNSATTLEIKAGFRQNGSSLAIEGKVKTAAPWLFMPFEVKDPIEIGPDHPEITEEYATDWTSNAASMIHHTDPSDTAEEEKPAETAAPASETEAEGKTESDVSENAEAAPIPGEESGDSAE